MLLSFFTPFHNDTSTYRNLEAAVYRTRDGKATTSYLKWMPWIS